MKPRISFQIAITLTLLALFTSGIVSIIYYYHIIHEEVKSSRNILSQLGQTVQHTAAIATYLNDNELGKEVIDGLINNEIVFSAKLTSLSGMSIPDTEPASNNSFPSVNIQLESPFTPGEITGELHITLDQEFITKRAEEFAFDNAAILGGYSLFIALIVFILVQWRFISGIKRIATNLNQIKPGRADRLATPARHKHDEIGGLILDINNLLNLTQTTLEHEHSLLNQVESLQRRFQLIFDRAGVGIFILNERARLVMSNGQFEEIIGRDKVLQVTNTDIDCLIEIFNTSDKVLRMIEETFKEGQTSSDDLQILFSDKSYKWVHCLLTPIRDSNNDSTEHSFVQGIISDITDRKNEENRIRYHAERDPLTHLLNRRSAQQSLSLLIEKSRFDKSCLAVCLIDLDNFKPINDTYGHDAGDKVLIEVASRMNATLRGSDLIARLGGDEFLVAIQGINNISVIEQILNKLIISISAKIEIRPDIHVNVGASIGVSFCPNHGVEYEELMSTADQAMYKVKQSGKKGFIIYDQIKSN